MYKDNFLDNKDFEEIQRLLTSHMLPWYLNPGVSYEGDGNIQMIHGFYNHGRPSSEFFDNLVPLINKMNIFSILRVKANFLHRTDKVIEYGYHVDIDNTPEDVNQKTAIYYINTNNGYTKFKTGEIVESVANRLVTFPSHLEHMGSTNTCNEPYRIVLNINYI